MAGAGWPPPELSYGPHLCPRQGPPLVARSSGAGTVSWLLSCPGIGGPKHVKGLAVYTCTVNALLWEMACMLLSELGGFCSHENMMQSELVFSSLLPITGPDPASV